MILGVRLTSKGYNQPASPHYTCKPLPASKAELVPAQWQGSRSYLSRGVTTPHAAEGKRPGSDHGLGVPEALLKQDNHLSPSLASVRSKEGAPEKPGASRAAAGGRAGPQGAGWSRFVTSSLLLALVLGI